LLGIQSKCFLTDASIPYQPFIGRGEALIAVHNIFRDQAGSWLRNHADVCYAMVNRLVRSRKNDKKISRPTIGALRSVFIENLQCQGASFDDFECYIDKIKQGHTHQIIAAKNGFVHINLDSLRSIIVGIQDRFVSSDTRFPDPCGVVLKRSSGEYVYKGDTLATIRCTDHYMKEFKKGTTNSIVIAEKPIPGFHFIEVSHG
jgi:pyrimidine-nucleoside phosphorylase